jgi:hypothetical protein
MSEKFDVDFGEFLYNRLPPIYREEDSNNYYTLERFISALNAGGFQTIIDSLNGLDSLIDIDAIPSEYLIHVSRLFGYEYNTLDDETYNPVLPDWFIRRLLSNIISLQKKKGTKSAINFIARELSGFKSSIIENKDFNAEQISLTGWNINYNNRKNFILNLSAPSETSRLQEKEDAVAYAIKDFLGIWSQAYIITTYWYEDSRNILNSCSESGDKLTINEVTTETKSVVSVANEGSDVVKITDPNTSESKTFNNKNVLGGENCCILGRQQYTLGTGGFLLNHATHYDIVKEDGKPDKIYF